MYVGSDEEGVMRAVDAATGATEWRFEEPASYAQPPTVVDGTVYFWADASASVPGEPTVYAVDAGTGNELWSFETEQSPSWGRSPTVGDGTVFFGDINHRTFALDAETGEERWVTEHGFYPRSHTFFDGTVYCTSRDNKEAVFALDPEAGDIEWTTTLEHRPGHSPVVTDGEIYVDNYRIDGASGKIEWRHQYSGVYDDNGTGGHLASVRPAVANGTVYTATTKSPLYAIDAETGDRRFRTPEDHITPWGRILHVNLTTDQGIVYMTVGEEKGQQKNGLYAFDGATGERIWGFEDMNIGVRTAPTVVAAPETGHSVDSRVLQRTYGHHHLADSTPLQVSLPAAETIAAGLESTYQIGVTNTRDEPLSGVTLELDAPDGVEARKVGEAGEVPTTLDPGEGAVVTVGVRVPPDRRQPVSIDITGDAEGIDPVSRTAAFTVQPAMQVSVVPEASDDPVRAGTDQGGTFTFEVGVNDVQAVEDVALVPRFDEVEGDWSVHEPVRNADALRHAGGRWGSADVPERSELNVWGAPELAPGMVEQPGLELTVPGGLSPAEYELPVELRVADADGERFVADETTYTFAVEKRYMSPLLLVPDEPLVDAEQVTLETELLVSGGSVVNPTLTLDPFPESFEVVDGSDPDGAFLSIEDRSVEWGGVFEADARLSAEFVVALPDGENAGGSYPVGLTATADVPELDAERTRSSSTVVTVSDLVGQVAGKRAKAERIDQVVGGVDDRQRVDQRLTAITDAVGAGNLDPVAASQGVERMWLGERLLERSHELTTGVTPTNTVDRGYDLIRPLAEDIVSTAVVVGTFGVAGIIKLAPSAGRIGGAAIRKAGQWGLKSLRRVIRDIVALGYRARQAAPSAPSIPQPLPDNLFDFFQSAVQDYVEGRTGFDEVKGQLSEPFVSRIEGHLRGSFEEWTAGELDDLHGPLTASALTGGPPGDQVAARGAFATALSGMEFRARRAHQLTGTFNEGLAPILGEMQGTVEEIYPLAEDPNVREILELTKQSFDLFMTFFTGGAVSMLIGGAAVRTIDAARGAGIQRLTEGRDIEGSL